MIGPVPDLVIPVLAFLFLVVVPARFRKPLVESPDGKRNTEYCFLFRIFAPKLIVMALHPGVSLNIPETSKPRVVIIGGGFGGLYAAHKIDTSKFQVVLFDKRNYHTFQPLLYQVATAGLQGDAIAGPLRTVLKKKKDFHFRLLRVLSIDDKRQTVATSIGHLHYDYLIVANGCRSNFFGNKPMETYAFPIKSIPDALNLKSQLMQTFESASMINDPAMLEKILTIVIVGGGPTGVETAGALAELRKKVLTKDYPGIDFPECTSISCKAATTYWPACPKKQQTTPTRT